MNRLFILFLVLIMPATAYPCTTAVVHGSKTKDGRPLLWKNRDFSFIDNEVIYLHNERFKIVAVANKGSNKSIWMGMNSAGFCIENSVSKDLRVEGATGPGNGGFMLKALENCANIAEFEQLLEETNKSGRTTCANFGVIDANGGAAIFETSSKTYTKFDANNKDVSPNSMVVRSNFSYEGTRMGMKEDVEKIGGIYSGNRYMRAKCLLENQLPEKVDAAYIIRHMARDMADMEGHVHPGSVNELDQNLPSFIDTKHTISRTTTVSSVVFQGVLPGEDPRLTTMWVMLGDPKFAVAVPVWAIGDGLGQEMGGDKGSSLCETSLSLRDYYFSEELGGIETTDIKEVWAGLWSTEDYILKATETEMNKWRKNGVSVKDALAFHQSMSRQAYLGLSRQLKNQEGKVAKYDHRTKAPPKTASVIEE
jgi:hypothetical protein